MSAEATGYVFRFSPYKGAAFSVHLAVADSVNDQNGNEFFMAQGKLAKKARVGRPAANAALARLIEDGYLEVVDDGDPLPKGIVRYRFLFVPGDVVFDSRRRPTRRRVARGDTGAPARRVARGDSHRSPRDTPPPPERVAHDDTEPKGTTNPKGTSAADGEGDGSDLATQARAIVQAHWDRCTAANRPRPVLKREGRGNVFMALAKIVEALLDAGYEAEPIASALWETTGGHTLQGLAVYLTKHRPPVDVERSTVAAPKVTEAEQEAAIAARLWPLDAAAAREHFRACFVDESEQERAFWEYEALVEPAPV